MRQVAILPNFGTQNKALAANFYDCNSILQFLPTRTTDAKYFLEISLRVPFLIEVAPFAAKYAIVLN